MEQFTNRNLTFEGMEVSFHLEYSYAHNIHRNFPSLLHLAHEKQRIQQGFSKLSDYLNRGHHYQKLPGGTSSPLIYIPDKCFRMMVVVQGSGLGCLLLSSLIPKSAPEQEIPFNTSVNVCQTSRDLRA